MHHTYMHQGQGSKVSDICIIHACIRIMDKCIIHMCSMATCIRIKYICIIHTYIRMSGSKSVRKLVRPSVRPSVRHRKVSHHRYMHHTYMHASGSRFRIIDMCIIHTCIRVKDRETLIYASYMYVSGSRIMDKCIIHMCIMVTCIRIKNIYMHRTCIHTSGSRITCMLQDQGPVP